MKKVFLIFFIAILIIQPVYSQISSLTNNIHPLSSKRFYNKIHFQRKGISNILLDSQNYSSVLISSKKYFPHIESPMDSSEQYDRGTIRIIGEVAVGAGLGLVITVPPLILYAYSYTEGFGNHSNSTIPVNPVIALYSAYILLSSYGVYKIAEGGNKELSFLPTLGFASLGGVLASMPFLITKIKDPEIFVGGLVVFPLIGALVYANIIAPYPILNADTSSNIPDGNTFFTHKDLYNKSLLMNINLFRIDL